MKKKLLVLFTIFLVGNIQAQEPRFESFNSGQAFTTITVDALNKKVWAGTTQNGIFTIDTTGIQAITDFTLFNGSASNGGPDLSTIRTKSMASDALGNVWIGHEGTNFSGTQGGMERISSNSTITHYSADRNAIGFTFFERAGLATSRLTSVVTDKNNRVWVAQKYHDLTSGSTYILTPGAYSYKDSNSSKFTTVGAWFNTSGTVATQPVELPYPAYTYNTPASATPQSRTMDAISCDKNQVWIAVRGYSKRGVNNSSDGGYIEPRVLVYDLQGNNINVGTVPDHGGFSFSDMGFPNGGVINGICANNDKGTWVTNSATGRGFSVYKNGSWHYLDPINYSQIIPDGARFNSNAVWKDKIGRVFLGTDKGLIVYNSHGDVTDINSYKVYTKEDYGAAAGNEYNIHDPNMLSSNITGGSGDPNNSSRNWVATNTGIMKLFLPLEGMILYNVKDHFSYTSITPDTDNKIILLTELKNEHPDSLAIDSEIPSIAADGSGSTLFRFKTDDPEGYYNIANPTYRLMVGPGPISQIDTEVYRKRYGQFTKKALESYEGSPTTADQLDYVEFIYTHPEYIDASDYQTNENYARFDYKIMNVSDSSNPTEEFTHPVKIAVPPVLLGHGVWSGIGSIEDMKSYFLQNGFDDYMLSLAWRPHVAESADIAAENSFDEDAWVIPTYIKNLKTNTAANMFSVGKVNVVVHSRGGLYTRGYVEEMNSNYPYKYDINSLITLDTPHFGSQGGNLALDKRVLLTAETIENVWDALISNTIPLELFIDNQDITLGTLGSLPAPPQDRVEGWGAKNLIVEIDNVSGLGASDNISFVPTLNDPSNLAKLSDYELPIHTISAEFDFCLTYPALCGDFSQLSGTGPHNLRTLIIIAEMAFNNYFQNGVGSAIEALFNGETSDFVVPLTSMQGGLADTNYNTNFDSGYNIDHTGLIGTGVTKATVVHDTILHLLRSNIHDTQNSLFTKNGLNHSKLTYNFLHDVLTSASQRNNDEFLSKILINRDPAIFDNLSEGDVLTFNVLQEDVDKIMVTYDSEGDSNNFTYEMRSQNLNFENQFTYTIPEGYSGEMTITAYGFNNDLFGLTKSKITLDVGIPDTVTLQSIHFEQEDPIILDQDNYSYNLIGTFSDGIERNINDFTGLTYAIEDASIISQIDNSSIKGEAVGTTLLTATINGFEDTILVNVQNNPSLQQTILTSFYGVPETNNTSIDILWETLREYENATFVLESSYNTPDNFTEVDQQPGNGTFSDPAQFSYNDASIGSNTLIYYRLKMIDTSGGITYSTTIEIDLSALSIDDNTFANFGLKLYPNPVNTDNVTLSLNSNLIDENAKLELYSLQGKRLSIQTLNVAQGSNTFNLKLSDGLSNGIYLVRITSKGYMKTIKLVVNK